MNNATIESSDEENDTTEATQSSDDKQFVGLDALYEHMLVYEDQLLCKVFQDKMGEKYDKIISSFLVCLSRLREAKMDDKRERVPSMRQSTFARCLEYIIGVVKVG